MRLCIYTDKRPTGVIARPERSEWIGDMEQEEGEVWTLMECGEQVTARERAGKRRQIQENEFNHPHVTGGAWGHPRDAAQRARPTWAQEGSSGASATEARKDKMTQENFYETQREDQVLAGVHHLPQAPAPRASGLAQLQPRPQTPNLQPLVPFIWSSLWQKLRSHSNVHSWSITFISVT